MLLFKSYHCVNRQLMIQSSVIIGNGNGKDLNGYLTTTRPASTAALAEPRSFDDVPSISNIPYFGRLNHYISSDFDPTKIHTYSVDWFHKFGHIFKEDLRILRADGKYAVWLYDADDIEKVYRSGGKYPFRGGFDPLAVHRKTRPDVFKSLGLLILNGTEWHAFRSKVQPVLLMPKSINNYSQSISSIADEMISEIRRLRNNQTMEIEDLTPEMYRFTLESVGCVGLDTRFNCLSDYGPIQKDIVASVKELFHLLPVLNESALWRIVGRPIGSKWKRFLELNDHFTNIVFKHVQEKLVQITSSPVKKPDKDRSVLEIFLTRPDVTPEDAVTMAMDMVWAGIDTTAHYIVFTLHYLANNPEIQERVYQEINLASNGTGQLDADQLSQLTLLRACLKETSRINPVAPISMRVNLEPIVLSGYAIPSPCFLVLNHYAMGRRPDYFDDPMTFNPDRWMRETRGDSKAHPFTVLPFGFGPRSCIGRRIAELETLTLLSKIVYNFKTKAKRSELPTSMAIIAHPINPMTFTFNERHNLS